MLNSGITNITPPDPFEVGDSYKPFDISYFSGYTSAGTEYPASQSDSGHYYYTGVAATSTTSSLPSATNSPWTNKFFGESSYGSTSVSFKNEYYDIQFGDGYYNYLSKSENSLRATFNLGLEKRSDKEAKAIIHLLEDSFNKGDKPSGGYTGVYWTPFEPYDKEHEFFVEQFDNSLDYPNVNTISFSFYNETESTTDWRDFYVPFDQTKGFFEIGDAYSGHDIIFASGSDYGKYTSGWYYNTGDSEVTSTSNNGPAGASSLWAKDLFYFSVNNGIVFGESPRYYKQQVSNDFFIRVNDGINKSLLGLNFTLIGRTDKEAKAIVHFLEKHRGKDQFLFTPPAPYNEQKVFVCPSWEHSLVFKDNNAVSVSFLEQPINYLTDEVEFLNLITIDPYLPL